MKLKSLIMMNPAQLNNVYGEDQINQIDSMTELICQPVSAEEVLNRKDLLENVQIIFSGWGMCPVDETFLSSVPGLKAIFYAAGSVRGFATKALFEKDIILTTAFSANAVPVAEFTFAQIILSLKKAQRFMRSSGITRSWEEKKAFSDYIPGNYGSTVGLVSLGMIGSMVLDFLKTLNVNIKVYDIFHNSKKAAQKGFQYCSLEEIFETCDVVSLHTAYLAETHGMITGKLIASMKKEASLINTARGGLIDEPAMAEVLSRRPDLSAFLDVMYPEPPDADNPLLKLPNVYITPHIAGSQQAECRRMGQLAVDECRRYLSGDKPWYQVSLKMMETMA